MMAAITMTAGNSGARATGVDAASSQCSSSEEGGEGYCHWPQVQVGACHMPAPAATLVSKCPDSSSRASMSAVDLALLDAFELTPTAFEPYSEGSVASSMTDGSSSCSASECGDVAAFPPAVVPAALHTLSRFSATAPKTGPTTFFHGQPAKPAAITPAGSSEEVVFFNWSHKAQRPVATAALETLVAAMAEDPVNAYLLGGTPSARFARKEIKGYLKALPKAAHFLCTPDAAAVALWQLLPKETPKNELLAGWTRILRVPLRLWPALVNLELHYEAAHAREAATAPGACYYYLSFIGTAPAARGKGYASLLMRHITARADQEGRICLLEATSTKSRTLYERHGFVCYETFCVTPAAPPVFFMRRDPQPLAPTPMVPAAAVAGAVPAPAVQQVVGAALAPAPQEAANAFASAIERKAAAVSAAGSAYDSDEESSFISAAVVVVDEQEEGNSEGKKGKPSAFLPNPGSNQQFDNSSKPAGAGGPISA